MLQPERGAAPFSKEDAQLVNRGGLVLGNAYVFANLEWSQSRVEDKLLGREDGNSDLCHSQTKIGLGESGSEGMRTS